MTAPSLQTLAPYLQQLSFGAIAGFAAGYALKKVGKLIAIAIGLLFVAIQLLAYFGFVSVDWTQVQDDLSPLIGSGSLNHLWSGLVSILTYNLIAAAAFIPALIFGLKRG